MNITIFSRSWPSHERSGVSLIAENHAQILLDSGHSVTIAGSDKSILTEKLSVNAAYYIPARGSGALYSPVSVDRNALNTVLLKSRADLVICEAWQTALTDTAVDIAHQLNIPVLFVSHGVSLHPFTSTFRDKIRAISWLHYRLYELPRRIKKLSAITTLDINAKSNRFYDRDIALRLGIPVLEVVNPPVNWRNPILTMHQRKKQILVIGYFSHVKNQMTAIDIFSTLPDFLNLKFIGPRSGDYFRDCLKKVYDMGLEGRVTFIQDNECDISYEIGTSLIVLSTSVTEVLPVTLIEAMASGTPFIATDVGAVPNIGAGIVATSTTLLRNSILSVLFDADNWNNLSLRGLLIYRSRYTQKHVRDSLIEAVAVAMR